MGGEVIGGEVMGGEVMGLEVSLHPQRARVKSLP